MGEVEKVVERFNGGLINKPDGSPRGFTTRYDPIAAMKLALEPITARNEQLEAKLKAATGNLFDYVASLEALDCGLRQALVESEGELFEANQLIRAIEGENTIVRAQLAEARAAHTELIMEVARKHEGETRHETYSAGEFKVHDLENLDDEDMIFMTVELIEGSANKPLPVPETVRLKAA